jgi:malate dehydrogenase
MERKDLLLDNGKIFIEQGRALDEVAAPGVVVLVVGNPCNTNCLIALHQLKRLSRRQFFAMTRLDQNRAVAQLARQAGVPVTAVSSVAIWGNHSSTQVPDFLHATIQGGAALERAWCEETFVPLIQKRGAAVIAARGKSSAASAAYAALSAMRSLMVPTPAGEIFSVGLLSDGNPYGIPEGLVFSFPCRSQGQGKVEIVGGWAWDPFLKGMIETTQKELLEERALVQPLLKGN